MLKINEKHLETFGRIRDLFLSKTEIPKESKWQSLSDNDVWLNVVAQVMVVGGSKPFEKFKNNENLKNQIAFENLLQIADQELVKKTINHVLRVVGTRYASRDLSKCAKSRALAYNFNFLRKFDGGPKGFLKQISEIENEKQRIDYVKENLRYIQNKGARDFLMELGIVRNSIAIDSRIQTILNKMGIEIPLNSLGDPALYEKIQTELLEKVCKPLNLSGIEFDRLLYQNYKEIMSS